ncbi:hypothetical protein RST01_16730 [Rummeliibacillus stabekisii]|nr:hypothetical protein RST01_16730 [Rummeliibacillus stabekisii]
MVLVGLCSISYSYNMDYEYWLLDSHRYDRLEQVDFTFLGY